VRGFRGEARDNADIENRVACDLEYLENWNLSLECGIILRTFAQFFFPPGTAY
jgi:undecaprenyl-phosphate galactose phosphotransferase/putative colanic acid biosynthesis UDP-glucose lipid carrier transferase